MFLTVASTETLVLIGVARCCDVCFHCMMVLKMKISYELKIHSLIIVCRSCARDGKKENQEKLEDNCQTFMIVIVN